MKVYQAGKKNTDKSTYQTSNTDLQFLYNLILKTDVRAVKAKVEGIQQNSRSTLKLLCYSLDLGAPSKSSSIITDPEGKRSMVSDLASIGAVVGFFASAAIAFMNAGAKGMAVPFGLFAADTFVWNSYYAKKFLSFLGEEVSNVDLVRESTIGLAVRYNKKETVSYLVNAMKKELESLRESNPRVHTKANQLFVLMLQHGYLEAKAYSNTTMENIMANHLVTVGGRDALTQVEARKVAIKAKPKKPSKTVSNSQKVVPQYDPLNPTGSCYQYEEPTQARNGNFFTGILGQYKTDSKREKGMQKRTAKHATRVAPKHNYSCR